MARVNNHHRPFCMSGAPRLLAAGLLLVAMLASGATAAPAQQAIPPKAAVSAAPTPVPAIPKIAAVPTTATTVAATAKAALNTTTATQRRDPGFYLEAEPKDPHIGDRVTIHLRAHDGEFRPDQIDDVTFDPDEKTWHLEAPWRRDWQPQTEGRSGPWTATLRPFQLGKLSLPATRVTYQGANGTKTEAQATTASLTVYSIRPPNSRQLTLVPMRDPVLLPRDWSWLWPALGVLAALLLAGWLLWRWWLWRRRTPAVSPEPELPPGLWALRELDLRSRLTVCKTGPAKAIFSHVSEVVRLYLGRRYGINAIDLTTLECLHALHALKTDDEVLRWIREFLDECDLVKFTTYEPAPERWRTIWHDARLIVKMTTPAEELGNGAAAESESLAAREVPA